MWFNIFMYYVWYYMYVLSCMCHLRCSVYVYVWFMYVCMYVIYVYVYVCDKFMCVCMWCTYVCICVCRYVIHVSVYVCDLRTCVCDLRACVCVYVGMWFSVYTYSMWYHVCVIWHVLCVCICVCMRLMYVCMAVSTENATHPKSTTSRNSDFSISRGTNSNWDFGLIWICTKEFEFLDLVGFRVVAVQWTLS